MNIAIVIPVYNRMSITIAGLNNIQAAIDYYMINSVEKYQLFFEIVVVDDGSTDGTSSFIRENFPNIKLINGDGNLWWSGSVNLGARYAIETLKSSHILLWNDDTICAEDYFLQLSEALAQRPELVNNILVSKIFWMDRKDVLFNFGCYFDPANGRKTLIGLNSHDNFDTILPVDWSGGMGTFIPSPVLEELNFLDSKNFPQYDGDIDFFLRAKKQGIQAYALPKLKIYNNPDTTGIHYQQKLKDLPKIITSNRSLHNLRKNLKFTKRHSNTLRSWAALLRGYVSMIVRLKVR